MYLLYDIFRFIAIATHVQFIANCQTLAVQIESLLDAEAVKFHFVGLFLLESV